MIQQPDKKHIGFVLEQIQEMRGANQAYLHHNDTATFYYEEDGVVIRTENVRITRALIEELLIKEVKNFAPFFRELKIIIGCSNTVRYASIRLHLIFVTTDDLIRAFFNAYHKEDE